MIRLKSLLFFVFFSLFFLSQAQNSRKFEKNTLLWLSSVNSFKLNSKLSIHAEFVYRSVDFGKKTQQVFPRFGLNIQLHPRTIFRFGYAFADTHPYGETPINSFGKNFPEHRVFQAILLKDTLRKLEINHRFMLEQRFLGKYASISDTKVSSFTYMNRIRYLLRVQYPLLKSRKLFTSIQDELLIGFGKNVNQNIFDQNRIGVFIGYKFLPKIKVEAGFLNQLLQLGREINNQEVFQKNSGVLIQFTGNF